MRAIPFDLLGFRRDARRPPHQIRRLIHITSIVRWIGLVVAGIIGVVAPPRSAIAFVLLILAVGIYNSWSIVAGRRADDASIARVARTATLFDQLGCMAFLAIFANLPGGSQSAFYVPMLIEGVAIDGVEGAISGVIVFVLGITAVQGANAIIDRHPFAWIVVLVWSLIMSVVAVALAALDQVSLDTAPVVHAGDGAPAGLQSLATPPGGSGAPLASGRLVRLSQREQEVLRLIAEGCSNGMIAERLHLSETTVKTYVENLLARLSARNRAEAVAAASRLHLL